jgi:hypothetical protein
MDVEFVEGNNMAQEIPSASIVESLYFNEFQKNALEHPKLHLHPPLPHMLNYFDLRWRRMLLSL